MFEIGPVQKYLIAILSFSISNILTWRPFWTWTFPDSTHQIKEFRIRYIKYELNSQGKFGLSLPSSQVQGCLNSQFNVTSKIFPINQGAFKANFIWFAVWTFFIYIKQLFRHKSLTKEGILSRKWNNVLYQQTANSLTIRRQNSL